MSSHARRTWAGWQASRPVGFEEDSQTSTLPRARPREGGFISRLASEREVQARNRLVLEVHVEIELVDLAAV